MIDKTQHTRTQTYMGIYCYFLSSMRRVILSVKMAALDAAEDNANYIAENNGIKVEDNGNNADTGETSSAPSKRRKLTSLVWQDFTKTKLEDGTEVAICNHCSAKLVGKSSSGTSHLRKHLDRCPRRVLSDTRQLIVSATQEPRDGSFDTVEILPAHSPKRRKLTSPVWQEFTKSQLEDGSEVATCNHCNTRLVGKGSSGTTHLKNHLNRCPRRVHRGIGQQVLLAIENSKDGSISVGNHTFDQESSHEDLALMIVLHEYPFSIVGFRKFVNGLRPLFKNVVCNTIKSDVLDIYQREKNKLCELLDRNRSRICITTNMWTLCQDRAYMSLAAHYIDDAWILQKRLLRFVYVPSPHTTEALTKVIMDSLLDWNIDRKLTTITLDNCSTNDDIASSLRDQLSRSGMLLLDGQVFHVSCFAEIMNLIVQDGLEVISEAMHKLRESVRYWTTSHAREEKFAEAVRQLKIRNKKVLSYDVSTRLDSTYLMLETALEFKDVFTRLAQRDSGYQYAPSEDDWQKASIIREKLKLFYDVTEIFSATKFPTTNMYFPEVCEIKLSLIEWSRNPDEFVSSMAMKMQPKFERYWSICCLALAIASILDPQYKMVLLKYYYNLIYDKDADNAINVVYKSIQDLFNVYKSELPLPSTDQAFFEAESCTSGGPPLHSFDRLRVRGFDKYAQEAFSNQNKKSELDMYLEESTLDRKPNFNVLGWWKNNATSFPTLSKMARDILAVPVSIVASESAFNTGGRVLDQYCSRMHPDTIEALMCAQDWLWSEIQVNCASSSTSRSTVSISIDLD